MALALLAAAWAKTRGGRLLALIVDHGLRAESGAEAALTRSRLAEQGIEARVLPIRGLAKGPAMADRAREARYRILRQACAEAGILHLLLGHHAADQAETMTIRTLSGSGRQGLAGMAAVAEVKTLRLLRPLLRVPPADLRAFLRARGIAWVEDPSNRDPNATRARIRLLRADPTGEDSTTRALTGAARAAGKVRADDDERIAKILADRATIRPEGVALLSPGSLPPEALAALVRTIAGSQFAPPIHQIAPIAAQPAACTLAGVRMLPAGRLGPGWLLVREHRSMAAPVPAVDGAIWDGRFRLHLRGSLPDGTMLGAIGDAAPQFRKLTDLPAAILRVMPALWRRNIVAAVPHLDYRGDPACSWGTDQAPILAFDPPRPLAGAPFCPA